MTQQTRRQEIVTLKSGRAIDLLHIDEHLSEIASVDEIEEIIALLQAKTITIEGQIGKRQSEPRVAEAQDAINPQWLVKANTALRYTRLARNTAQLHHGRLLRAERKARHERNSHRFEARFVEIVRSALPREQYEALSLATRESLAASGVDASSPSGSDAIETAPESAPLDGCKPPVSLAPTSMRSIAEEAVLRGVNPESGGFG